MVKLDKIYTRGGDGGLTGLGDGSRVTKAGPRIAAIGAVDEANAAVGIAVLHARGEAKTMLTRIQNDLFDLGADLCVPQAQDARIARKAEGALRVTSAQVARLEREIDTMNQSLTPLTSFVLPGGTALAAHLHMARAIVRRAETQIVALAGGAALNPAALQYANRLSDHLFVMARLANHHDGGTGDVLWRPGETGGH